MKECYYNRIKRLFIATKQLFMLRTEDYFIYPEMSSHKIDLKM